MGLYGVDVANYATDTFEYDSVHHVATWTLQQPIGADRLMIRLDGHLGGVTDIAGNCSTENGKTAPACSVGRQRGWG